MRRRRRNRKWILPVVVLALALICGLLLRFVFVVRSVQVTGHESVMGDEAVVRATHIAFGSSILNVDEDGIRDQVNATGTLKFESMSVQYPDTIYIRVSPRTREAMLLHMGKIRVLDAEACVMESLDSVPDMDLIYVSGLHALDSAQGRQIQADEDQLEAYCAVIEALNRHNADIYVSELKLDDPFNMQIITRTGITVDLGDMQKITDKIAWMKSAVADLEQRGEKGGVLDVRSGSKADYSVRTAAGQ